MQELSSIEMADEPVPCASGMWAQLHARALRCEHVVLYGPRGIGKTAHLRALEDRLHAAGVACARSPSTASLSDITTTLVRAYRCAGAAELTQRQMRGRLQRVADERRAIVLLDHVTGVTVAMKAFLRRLRGGAVGVVLAVDVDACRERERMRQCGESLTTSSRRHR